MPGWTLLYGFVKWIHSRRNIWLQRRKENQKKEKHKSLHPRLLLTVWARSAVYPPSFQTLVSLECRRVPGLHRQPQKHTCKLSLRQHSKQKDRKPLGGRKSWKHSFLLSRSHLKPTKQHLKKTKICCARPKKKWRGCIPCLKRLMHCCELCWNFRKIEVGLNAVSVDHAFA